MDLKQQNHYTDEKDKSTPNKTSTRDKKEAVDYLHRNCSKNFSQNDGAKICQHYL